MFNNETNNMRSVFGVGYQVMMQGESHMGEGICNFALVAPCLGHELLNTVRISYYVFVKRIVYIHNDLK